MADVGTWQWDATESDYSNVGNQYLFSCAAYRNFEGDPAIYTDTTHLVYLGYKVFQG
jgi:hypothetical protein